jgi:hypothetical protein
MKAISTLFLLLIAVFPFAQPTNDTPCTAQPIEINGAPAEGDNTDATTDAGEVVPPPAAGGNSCVSSWCNDDVAVQNSMWYSFVAPAAGAVIITTCNEGSILDTQLALWQAGDCSDYGTFTPLIANDDIDGGCDIGSQYSSGVTIDALAPGATYYIQIDGWDGETGFFILSVQEAQPTSLVNLFNVCSDPSLTALDVRMDGDLIADNLNYLTCSTYLPVSAGVSHTLSIHDPGSTDASTPLASLEVSLNPNIDYEIALTGLGTSTGFTNFQPLQLVVIDSALQFTNVAGSAPLRYFHASTDAPSVNFINAQATQTLAGGLSYGNANAEGYVYANESFDLTVTDANGAPTGLAYCVPAGFFADFGLAFTIVATGFLNPTANNGGDAIGLYIVDWTSGDFFPLELGGCAFPDNDDLCSATELIVNDVSTMADNTFATVSTTEDMPFNLDSSDPESDCLNAWCDGTLDNTVWFSFQAPGSGCVAISTCFADSEIDTQIALCTSEDCNNETSLNYIAANDDMEGSCVGNTYSSELTVCGLIPGSNYYIQTDGYEGEAGIFYIQVTEPLAVEENNVKGMSVYPNPAVDQLFIDGMPLNTEVEILDVSGKVVYRGKYEATGVSIENLETGSYLVKSNATQLTTRFIKL